MYNMIMTEMKRVMISIKMENYKYCKSHFIKISDLCDNAISNYKDEMDMALGSLVDEIPPLVKLNDGKPIN